MMGRRHSLDKVTELGELKMCLENTKDSAGPGGRVRVRGTVKTGEKVSETG